MKISLYLFAFLLASYGFCQNTKQFKRTYASKEPPIFSNEFIKQSQELDLIKILESPYPFHFRLWSENQILEIWQTEKQEIKGQFTNWIKEFHYDEEEPTNRIFFKSEELDIHQVYQINHLIDSLAIQSIPSCDSIAAWQHGILDGAYFFIEYADKKHYYFKHYNTPGSHYHNSIPEAMVMDYFIAQTFDICNSGVKWNLFRWYIPFECYQLGIMKTCKMLSPELKEAYREERETYRQSQKQKE